MPDLVIDFSGSRPDPDALVAAGVKAIMVYTGSARPSLGYLHDVLDRGIGVCFVHEVDSDTSWTTGRAGGIRYAKESEQRADEYGYPDDAMIWYVVSDGNKDMPGPQQGGGIANYVKGIGDTIRRPRFGVYGNRFAVDTAKAAHPKCVASWVPETWHANNSDAMWQKVGGTPIPNTDANVIVDSIHELGAWGLTHAEDPEVVVLFRAQGAADGVDDGVVYADVGTRFLRVDNVPAGAIVIDQPGSTLSDVRAEKIALNDAAAKIASMAAPQVSGLSLPNGVKGTWKVDL